MRIFILNLHGLVKGSGLEIGRDADNGGQTKYVTDLAEHLSKHEEVTKVHLFTRKIKDEKVSKEYGATIEEINPKFDIRRIEFGGLAYKMKEELWDHLDEFVANTLLHIKEHDIKPDWLHSHYGDAGYAATKLSIKLNVPFAHTGHSLGLAKKQKMIAGGMTEKAAEERFKFKQRISAEEGVLALSEFIVTSTYLEIADWEQYKNYNKAQFHVQPPGVDVEKFSPYYIKHFQEEEDLIQLQRRYWVGQSIEKFLTNPNKPVIMALSRPDRRKNLHMLIEAYGEDKELQALANLAIFAGIRKDINTMPDQEKEVLTELLLLMDKYDLYGKLAIPKRHDIENEVALIYQYCANKRGVFANICLHENFGLTTIEAGGTGLPVVITKNGGPSEIVPRMKNGLLVDPLDKADIQRSLRKVLTNETKWRQFSDNGIVNTKKHYSWNSHTEVYVSWVQESLERTEPKTAKELNAPREHIQHLKQSKSLIITDIDGTLIAPEFGDPGIDELKHYLKNRPQGISFALSSGRNFELVKEVVDAYNLDVEFIVCSVGTEIYYDTNKNSKDEDWSAYLDYKWDREKVLESLSSVGWMELQEENAQNPHKISFYCDPKKYDEEKIKNRLGRSWYHVNVISSHNRFVDILPKRASKGNAILYLCHKWGLQLNKVYACGDSGNDLDMFREPINGIVVGNASEELKHLKTRKKLYVAEKYAAAGILEGLEYYKLK